MEVLNSKQGCQSLDCSCGRGGDRHGRIGTSLKPIRTLFNGLKVPEDGSSSSLLRPLSPISPRSRSASPSPTFRLSPSNSLSPTSSSDDMKSPRSGHSPASSVSSFASYQRNPLPDSPSFNVLGARVLKKVAQDQYGYEEIIPSPSSSPVSPVLNDNPNLTFLQMLRQGEIQRKAVTPPHERSNYTPPTPEASPLLLSLDPEKIRPLIPRRKPVRRRNHDQHSTTSSVAGSISESDSMSNKSSRPVTPPFMIPTAPQAVIHEISEESEIRSLTQSPSWKLGDDSAFTPSPTLTPTISARIPSRKPVSRSPTLTTSPLPPTTKSIPPPLLFNASDDVLLQILSYMPDMRAVRNFALVHPRFLNLVRTEKLYLFKTILKRTNTSAWSLLEKRNPEAVTFKTYLAAYKSCDTIIKCLVGRIRERCRGFLRPEWQDPTTTASDTSHVKDMEDAIWTFWDFTSTFGADRDTIADIDSQVEWLYQRCNSTKEIHALLEISSCLLVLVRPLCQTFDRKTAAKDDVVLNAAKAFGIVASDSSERDCRTTLEIFAGFLLSLGPQYIFVIEGYLIPTRNEPYSDNLEKVYKWLDSMDALDNWNPTVTESKEERNFYEYFLRRPAGEVYGRLERENRKCSPTTAGWGEHNLKD